MAAYLARRLGYSLFILWGVVTVVFLLFHLLPGDPARLTMGQRSDAASLAHARHQLHLDKPPLERYLIYLNDLSPVGIATATQSDFSGIRFCPLPGTGVLWLKWPYLGRSYRTQKKVNDLLWEALPGTALLAVSALLFATVVGLLLGIISAVKKGTWVDQCAMLLSVAGISLPSFFAGLLIAWLLGYVWHSVTGLDMTGSLFAFDPFTGRHIVWRNLVLPALALGIRPVAIITQLTRSAMLDTLSLDFIRTAYAKGLPAHRVIFRHALPNSLNPVITAVSGWLAELLAGSFFVEYIFGWKGIGKLTIDALDKYDFPLVMGSVLLASTLFIFINMLTDMLYAWIDPRVKMY